MDGMSDYGPSVCGVRSGVTFNIIIIIIIFLLALCCVHEQGICTLHNTVFFT